MFFMRCFIAVDIPDSLKEKIAVIQKEIDLPELKLVEKENLHITIKFLGEIDDEKVEGVKDILNSIDFPKFKIKLKGVGCFPNEKYIRVIWIGCLSNAFVALAKYIGNSLSTIGFQKETNYIPHLTIARVKKRPSITLFSFLERHKTTEIGNFLVEKIFLKKSTLTPKGPIYEDIHEISLK